MNSKKTCCPLCQFNQIYHFHTDPYREYFRCKSCHLIFVPEDYFLSPGEEKKRYDSHQNSPDDPHYRQFLTPLFQAVKHHLPKGARGLDFGCGPGPTLSKMFEESGFTVELFDHFYHSDQKVLNKKFDFITATEVFEHLCFPDFTFRQIWSCLKSGGILGIRTDLFSTRIEFSKWHYIRDDTHVCFYSPETFKSLARKWKARIEFPAPNIILLFKKKNIHPETKSI